MIMYKGSSEVELHLRDTYNTTQTTFKGISTNVVQTEIIFPSTYIHAKLEKSA